jgi:mannitol/fructose-specific phosphotransferase system IIA component (Ntr-type)
MPLDLMTVDTCHSLADFTCPALLIPKLQERDTAGAVKELSQGLHQQGYVPDLLAFYHAALNHEFLVNSATSCGIALPHARLNAISESRFAYGRSSQGIGWGSGISARIEFVFLLAVPATDAAGFLQLLSAIARLGQQESLRDRLRSRQTPEELFDFFQQIKVRHL